MAPTDAQEVHHVRAIVGVAVAGAIGALIRWGLGTAIGQRFPQFPWATMRILPIFDEMVGDGMMTLETVHFVTYRATPKTD
jgi:high-affinity Fe2+/Pb2+ permease